MFPGFLLNLSLFLSPALGQLGVGPLSHGCAVPASRLPPRVLSASGRRPAPTDAAAETGRWATSHRDVAAPKGEPSLASPLGGRWCPVGTVQRLVSAAASVGDGRSPLGCITRAGRRECPRRGRRGLLQQPTPRMCASLLMSTSEASCHRREWRAQALGRESPGVQPPGSFCLVKGKSEVFFRDFSLFAGESGCFLQNPRAVL